MDPYIETEELWPDFHQELATVMRTQLIPQIRPKYRATVDTTIVYEEISRGKSYPMRPDVLLYRESQPASPQPAGAETVHRTITPAPVIQEVELMVEHRLRAINIYTTKQKQLVTSIEILSPANKVSRGPAYEQYIRKRNRLWSSPVHIIEIDLLRAGHRIILGRNLTEAAYYATLSRSEKRPIVEIWPMPLGQPLPNLPVPLLAPDPDVVLDLNGAIATIYDHAGYDYGIDYHQPPPPPLSDEEQARVTAILGTGGQ